MFYQILWGINVKATPTVFPGPIRKHIRSLWKHRRRPDFSFRSSLKTEILTLEIVKCKLLLPKETYKGVWRGFDDVVWKNSTTEIELYALWKYATFSSLGEVFLSPFRCVFNSGYFLLMTQPLPDKEVNWYRRLLELSRDFFLVP